MPSMLDPRDRDIVSSQNALLTPPPAAATPPPPSFDFDPEALKAEQEDAASRKRNLALIGGITDALGSGQSWGNFYLGHMNPTSRAGAQTAQALSDSIEDPAQKRAKLYEQFKMAKEAKSSNEQDAELASKKDPNSKRSLALKALAPRWGIQATPEMSAYDIEQMIDPKKMMETEAKSQVDFNNDMAKLRFSKSADLEKFRQEQGIRSQEKQAERSKLSEKQLSDVQQYDDTINSLQDMLGSAKPNYIGAVDGHIPDMLVSGDEAAFRSRVGRYTDAYRKLITGAGASNNELKRLESRLPQTTDTFDNFKAKAQALLDETRKAKERHLAGLDRLGKNTADFKADPTSTAPKAYAGKTVVVKGKRYKVADDGDSLIPIENVAGK